MQVECSDEGFFMLPPCVALWNLFKEAYILPFMYKRMLEYDYKMNQYALESTLKIISVDNKFYQDILFDWKNCNINETNENIEIYQDIGIYLDFLSTFIMKIIQTDSIRQHLKSKEIYQHIESLLSKNLYIELLCVDNDTMQEINKEYMSKDYPTDVLSFPLVTQDIEVSQCLGSIIINMYAVCDGADFYKHNIYAEISLLFIHAFLHILGFDHESDCGTQRFIEQEIIAELNLPKSLIMRVE